MKALVQVPAFVDAIRTVKAGGLKIVFESQVTSAEVEAKILALRDKYGTLFFLPEGAKAEPIPETVSAPRKETGNKTPSQRLRAVIYREWEQRGRPGDQEEYYTQRMSRIIGSVKEQLEPVFI